ncbi:NADH-quinone oxidoreductase subunit NuoF family protein [Actinomadura sp. HBU206391]|uniref:NADH-quinone oxidoreductase subunit NuoF family protein n=1 Tax=Actinomadura sp. HBU206391 TaxID=2731692 RepID=UPI00164F1891|nr:NADH-quinone oxidoreductase subunit NuoF family protein [Actinomadura sp. HBU206391]MBC6461119.1 ferredoxin [Actinomadura sp. HBU206391]
MTGPAVTHVGIPRLTRGFDRFGRLDLDRHRAAHGRLHVPRLGKLTAMAERVDLRGRGGAGFPFARKLRVVGRHLADGAEITVVVNGAEGEPGSAKDQVLLMRAPHLVLDGAVIAARALDSRDLVVAVTGGDPARQSIHAAAAERDLPVRVVELAGRFISGESGAVVRAINGDVPVPPGRDVRTGDSGVAGRPTLLSNAETFAQLALLVSLGADGYARVGTRDEPGTILLTVAGGTVVEAPIGTPLGTVLERSGVSAGQGVLVGGCHGGWLPAAAAHAPVSRAGMAAAGGTLGAGVVLPLPPGTCPLGEVIRVTAYLAAESAGQCGPCRLGLPETVRALTALADGTGTRLGVRAAADIGRGRGACSHPDGTARFVLSALDVFDHDITAHQTRGGCGLPVHGRIPLSGPRGDTRLTIDWTRCDGHGLCAHLAPELVRLDRDGYPVLLQTAMPPWSERDARRAVSMCPTLALRLAPVGAPTMRGR